MSICTPISGYDFADAVITHRRSYGDVVETLCRYSENTECDWLEFKASVVLLEKFVNPGDTQGHLYWDIAHALIAMMNSTGGALIIGVDDKSHTAIPFEGATDPDNKISKGGIEEYIRTAIMSHVNPVLGKSWTDKNHATWSIEGRIPVQIRPEVITYQGKQIVALLVPPSPAELVFVNQKTKFGRAPKVPYRLPGSIGQVCDLETQGEWDNYKANRKVYRECFKIWAAEVASPPSFPNAVDEPTLQDKIHRFANDLSAALKELDNYVDLTAALCEMPQNAPCEEPPLSPQPLFQSDEQSEEETFDFAALRNNQSDTIDEFDNDSIHTVHNSECPLLELLEQEPRIALIGEPGQGKSTGLRKFAITKMTETSDRPALYLYIELGRWHAGGSIEALIRSTISLQEFESLRKSRRIHLILDALNECADDLKPGAKCSIQAFLKAYPDLPVVISARKPEDVKDFNFRTYVVCPLDRAHQEQYLAKRLNDRERAVNLLDSIYARRGGESLASNLMLLRMAADVASENPKAELPAGRANLYRTWTRRWFAREVKKAHFAHTSLDFDTQDDVRRYIAEIAFIGRLHDGQRAVPTSLVAGLISQRKGGERNVVFQGPLLRLKYDDERKQRYIHFLHETFQEYLCGERLLEFPDEARKLQGQDVSTWEMPIAYALELNGNEAVPPLFVHLLDTWSPWLAAVIRHNESTSAATPDPIGQFFAKAYDSRITDIDLIDMFMSGWYSQSDTTLTYTLSTNARLRQEWLAFEKNVFNTLFSPSFIDYTDPDLARKAYNRFFNSRLALTFNDLDSIPDAFTRRISEDSEFVCNILTTEFISPDNIPEQILEKINRKKSKLSATQLLVYKRNQLISEAEFLQRSRALIKRATLSDAALLIEQGIAKQDDFNDLTRAWDQKSVTDVEVARTMMHARLLDTQGLLDIFRALQMTPSPAWARQAMEYGLLTKQNLAQLARPLLKADQPTINEIRFLNLIMQRETQTRMPSWLPTMPLEQIEPLYKENLVANDSVQPIIAEFLSACEKPTAGEILALCTLAPQTVQDNAVNWIHALGPADLAELCEADVMLPAALANGIRDAVRATDISSQPSVMRRLICSGVIPRDMDDQIDAFPSIDVALDRMNSPFGTETPLRIFDDETMSQAVVIESTPRYAILRMMDRNRTAICLPSTLQERMMVLGDVWAIKSTSTSKGYKVEQAELLAASPWRGVDILAEATYGKQTSIGLKMKADGISHPVYWRPSILNGVNPFGAKRWQIELAPRFCRSKNRFLLAVLKARAL